MRADHGANVCKVCVRVRELDQNAIRQGVCGFRAVGMKDVSMKLYPGARHEVLNELNKEEVWKDVLSWIEDKIR